MPCFSRKKKRALPLILLFLTCSALTILATPVSTIRSVEGFKKSGAYDVPDTIRVLMPDGSVSVMDVDEYLKGVVPAEVSPSWPYAALAAQAIAARSFASTAKRHPEAGADVCTTSHCQVWKPEHDPRTDVAVDSTHKMAILYEGEIISAFYFGHCDGHTRNSEDVWGSYLPYLRSVSCPCGFKQLYGHGVGMCQEGARVLAESGHTYSQILEHYYTGTRVGKTEKALTSFYFAEGTTRPGFQTYLCIANPTTSEAEIRMRYLLSGEEKK
ncbi:MAG: SpoIID/LytB domain-containing protein, partial [Actinomycetota bacterium]|nr:SpoIID/LytB domain-containing protein [Actinomycetota bacterium]